jgi:hypothetical protein
MGLPTMHHRVHFLNTHFVEMQQWYIKSFDATLRPGQTDYFIGADLPGVGYMLNFFSWLPAQALVGKTGRAIHTEGSADDNKTIFSPTVDITGLWASRRLENDAGACYGRFGFHQLRYVHCPDVETLPEEEILREWE